jgi:uncharacterized membrane protein YkvA (DUF1232 family)
MQRTTIIRTPDHPTHAVQIDEFIVRAGEAMTSDRLRDLRRFEKGLIEKLATDQARQHRDLHESVTKLRALLRSDAVTEATDPLPRELAEAGVALEYLLKGVDIIPDSLPEIGLTDDARIVARVMERNPALSD